MFTMYAVLWFKNNKATMYTEEIDVVFSFRYIMKCVLHYTGDAAFIQGIPLCCSDFQGS